MPKILAVDDSATMRRIYEMTFAGQEGVEVVTVDSAEAAIRHVMDRGADLVLADASMNGSNGYDVAKALRESAATASTPVVLLASQQAPFDAERARAAGIEDHILKPFDTQSLIDKAKDVMGRARGGKPAAPRPVAAAPQILQPSPPTRTPTIATASAAPIAAAAPVGGGAVAAPRAPQHRATASFGAPSGAKPPVAVPPSAVVSAAVPAGIPARPAAAPVALTQRKDQAEEPARVSAATAAATNEMAGKLSGMGLSPDQVTAILALSREVIERVVWEVVPDMAERIIKDEIKRLTS